MQVSCSEFYYMQMEKYAKHAIAEGVQDAEEIHVTTESEIFKMLNSHYNRNNHIAVGRSADEQSKDFVAATRHAATCDCRDAQGIL